MKKQYWINIKNVDNRLVIFLDGETIWDSGITKNDPAINKFIEITDLLRAEPDCSHEIIFEGFNNTYHGHATDADLNPWHFHYRIVKRTLDTHGKVVNETDIIKPYDERHVSNPHIRAISNSYRLTRRDGEFRVIANSLSEQFYN